MPAQKWDEGRWAVGWQWAIAGVGHWAVGDGGWQRAAAGDQKSDSHNEFLLVVC
jgi:hypothetical protein